jgi:hypothetical protein
MTKCYRKNPLVTNTYRSNTVGRTNLVEKLMTCNHLPTCSRNKTSCLNGKVQCLQAQQKHECQSIKTKLTYFLDIKGTIHTNMYIHSKTLKSWNTDISALFNKKDRAFGQHYNELSHTALSIMRFSGKEQVLLFEHSLYSLSLSQWDLFMVSKLKILKVYHFQ